ncbi:helix-turn-helix domain-containing protein [Caulobacter sp. 602-2]|uniref:Helix-turn-helix domain-containing protein n=1 Tax=Caulobacter sp. 602-2 TaxID=2710887 RepID=A0A6G4QV14_9CAUL|nr:helix-turn-helix domain-containing protein [Caulobacter sp. 602-2]NGM49279.1 helix-turn-helix domain-containing protein [Caulobacter sp. 602-2]
MSEQKFLTTEEVADRYRGQISVGTLENWRTWRIGPPFLKVGKAVLYPVDELEAWDRRNLVSCDDAKVVGRRRVSDRDTKPRAHS